MAQTITDYSAFLTDAREAVEELAGLERREAELEAQEKRLERTLEAEKKAVADAIHSTIRRRNEEICSSYDKETVSYTHLTYQNLQTNVCQATIQPTRSCVNLKVYEVAPYYLDTNFNVVPFNAITVNLDTWNELPEEVQTILTEVGAGYLDYEAEYINTIHEEDLENLEAQGCTVTTLSREEQEKWAASLDDVVNLSLIHI